MEVEPIPPNSLEFHNSKPGIPRANLWNCETGSGTAELLWNSWNFRTFSETRCRNLNTLWELNVWNFQAWKFRVLFHTPHIFLDTVGNEIDHKSYSGSKIPIEIATNSYTAVIIIQQDGSCPSRDIGIQIPLISMDNETITLQISHFDDITYPPLLPSKISMTLVGCPLMFGLSDDDRYCIQCNTDYFNLNNDSNDHCASCDPNKNPNVNCIKGDIFIATSY